MPQGKAAGIETFYEASFASKDHTRVGVEGVHRFLIGQACGKPPMMARAEEASKALGSPAVPWGAVCAPLNSGSLTSCLVSSSCLDTEGGVEALNLCPDLDHSLHGLQGR